MKNGFTDRARNLLQKIQAIARSHDMPQPTIGHVLLAMLQDGRSVAAAALTESGITLRDQDWLEEAPSMRKTAFVDVSELKRLATQEAVSLGHSYPGPEHLLLALLGASFRHAVDEYLSARHCSAAKIRNEVFAILGYKDPLDLHPEEQGFN